VRHQWASSVDYIPAYVRTTPGNIDLILGADHLNKRKAQIDLSNQRMAFTDTGLTINTDTFPAIRDRMKTRSLVVVATNSGCNLAYCTMRNLGYSVSSWYSVEADANCRAVTDQIIPSSELIHVTSPDGQHDTTKCVRFFDHVHADYFLDTSPCQPFSRLQKHPKGFEDHRAKPMLAAANILSKLRLNNPGICYTVENVEPHPDLAKHETTLENLWGAEFTPINAKDWGSPSSRPRLLATNIHDISKVPKKTPTPPQWILQGSEHHCPRPAMSCIVASETTWTVPQVIHDDTNIPRRLSIAESEAFQMWPPHVTNGVLNPLGLSYTERLRMVGNAVNGAHMWHILRPLNRALPEPLVVAPSLLQERTADQLELHLSSMDTHALEQWVADRLEGYELPKFHLTLKAGATPTQKLTTAYPIPAGLIASAKYALMDQCTKGLMKGPVEYKEDDVEGGTVTKVTPDLITIHIMRPAPKKKKLYFHLWRPTDSALPLDAPFEDYERASWGVKPHSASPVTVAVKPSDIIVAGEIAKGYINQKMIDHLKSMGIIV
jgi:hypothetical protein